MAIPDVMSAWQLYGAGFENFGKEDQPVQIPVPEPKDDELLVKINAIGLCFSDVKLIRAGEEHPRVHVDSLKANPVVPGHEAVMTVVKVGKKMESKFRPGQRFIIQADIYVNGRDWSYGYAIDGGYEQYSILDQRVLNGDEGCYLLPLADSIPSAVAALFEPWTCVLASYHISKRTAPLKGGRMLFVFGEKAGSVCFCGLQKTAEPAAIAFAGNVPADVKAKAVEAFPKAEVVPAEGAFDDVFLIDTPDVAPYKAFFAKNACVSLIRTDDAAAGNASVDVGSIHYQGWFFQGARSADLSQAYGRNVRPALRKGGACWLPGGAGAMGQMHTQLAVSDPEGPSRVLVSDMDDARLEKVDKLFRPAAEKRGVEFKLVNPSKISPEEFDRILKDFAPNGFDDIVMLVPVPAVLSGAVPYLAKDGLMNIFAGIPAGKEAILPLEGIISNGVRFIGSSGSSTADLRHTTELVAAGKLQPVTALAAIGGMKSLKKGLEAVAGAKFPGKTVIFPNCPDMPLVPVTEMETLGSDVAATLKDGQFTRETEEVIVRKFGC